MKVISLLGSDFSESCSLLSQKISKSYNPDLVIGVLTGGSFVAKNILCSLPHNDERLYIEVKVQRSDTKKKEKGIVKYVLSYSPTFLLNWMRILESLFLEMKAKRYNPKREGKIELPVNIDSFLKTRARNILLVDDAIDSGATLNLIKAYLLNHYKDITVKIAVITVTTTHPIVDADYSLFHDRILVRFPWSNDVKKK